MLKRGILLSITIFAAAAIAADGPNLTTVEHLQTAHRAEMNKEARYLAYATKADEEGYKQVASLFRAVARAEQILYTYHYDAIKELGATPEDVVPGEVTVASTKDNLEKSSDKAIGDQLDSEYIAYAKAARTEGNRTAAKVFDCARVVEAQNFRLFAAAVKNMDRMRGNPSGYYICGLTGFVSVTMEPVNCASPDWERVR